MDDGFLKYYFENELYLENLPLNMKQFIESLKEEDISKDLIDKDTAIEMLETIYLDKVKV